MSQSSIPLLGNLLKSPQEFNTGTMRIHGDVLEFKKRDNTLTQVYRVSNISSVSIIERKDPVVLIVLAIASFMTCLLAPLGVLLSIQIINFYLGTDRLRMEITLNSGGATSIVSGDIQFLRDVAGVIRDIMNGANAGLEAIINVDQRHIDNRQINIAGNLQNATASIGDNNRFDRPTPSNMPRAKPAASTTREPADGRDQAPPGAPPAARPTSTVSRAKPAAPTHPPTTANSVAPAPSRGPVPKEPPSGVNRIRQPGSQGSNGQED
jgi:hypothetical protein